MLKKLVTSLLAIFLVAFCLCITPPRAWEITSRPHNTTTPHDIPHLKPFQDSSWYIHPHKRLKHYNTTCAQIAQKADSFRKLRHSFKALRRSSTDIRRSNLAATSEQNISKNRNRHLFAFDETRSCRDIENFYVNANDVETPLQSYMVAQGPLDDTVVDFWKAILHKNSQIIVTLVMAQEEGREKCASYWTIPEVQFEGWKVSLEKSEHIATSAFIPTHKIIVRTFLATNGQQQKTIKQVHYENWPDGKIPDLDLFIKLLDEVDRLVNDQIFPITVHCSAGIGRSGTFVAAHSLRKEVRQAKRHSKHPPVINIPKAIFLLRCQRLSLVGSSGQYKTVFQTLAKEHQPRRLPYFIF